MNRPLRQVVLAYLCCVLLACAYVPWEAQPAIPAVSAGWLTYDFLWQPPQTFGYRHQLARGRLLLEVASLTVILLAAACRLRGDGETNG
jgi:hypothetical protein